MCITCSRRWCQRHRARKDSLWLEHTLYRLLQWRVRKRRLNSRVPQGSRQARSPISEALRYTLRDYQWTKNVQAAFTCRLPQLQHPVRRTRCLYKRMRS